MTGSFTRGRGMYGGRTEASAPTEGQEVPTGGPSGTPAPTEALQGVRRGGALLPTVVPTDSRALSCPPIGELPRNRLASSATGGASPISPPAGDREGRPYGGANANCQREIVEANCPTSSRLSVQLVPIPKPTKGLTAVVLSVK